VTDQLVVNRENEGLFIGENIVELCWGLEEIQWSGVGSFHCCSVRTAAVVNKRAEARGDHISTGEVDPAAGVETWRGGRFKVASRRSGSRGGGSITAC
jgi:hypothetical protein